MLYRVRKGFTVHLGDRVLDAETETELTDDEAALVAHQVELVNPPPEPEPLPPVEDDDDAPARPRRVR